MKTCKTFISFLLLFLCLGNSFAQTVISAGEEVYGTWNIASSPYMIEGEVIVPTGKTLTIEPGVDVKFRTGEERDYPNTDIGYLRVDGKLIAKGEKDNMVRFTRQGEEGNWGVVYVNGEGSEFSYCIFEFGYYVREIAHEDNATAVLTAYHSTLNVSNCCFILNGWTALNGKGGANINAVKCAIIGNKYAAEANSASTISLTQCQLTANETSFYCNGQGLIQLSKSGVDHEQDEDVDCVTAKKNVRWDNGFDKKAYQKLGVFTSEELDLLEELLNVK